MDSKFSNRYLNLLSDKRSEELKALVEKWLNEMDVKVESIQEPNLSFNFLVTDPQGKTVQVCQPLRQTDVVVMQTGFEFPEQYLKRLSTQDASARNGLLWDLYFAVLDTQLAFEMKGTPPKSVVLRTEIYSDALTKDRFVHEFTRIRRGLLKVQWTVERELNKQVPTGKQAYIG